MNNSISERDMFMLMMENAEKKTAKKPTCKEAFEHREEFEYVGDGWGNYLYHKIHKDLYILTFSWKGYLWRCISDGCYSCIECCYKIYKVLGCVGKVRQKKKDELRNYLKKLDGVVAVYCKVVSFDGRPTNDNKYLVVFHHKYCCSFSIPEFFTEEELTEAKNSWKFVEEWEEVKSIKDILSSTLLGVKDAVEIIWKVWQREELISCEGQED